jgi:hypothetical protein
MTLETLLTQPRALRALKRSILGVGAAGIACATLAAAGGGLMDVAASAAVTGGGLGSGHAHESVEGLASGGPVEVAQLAAESAAAPVEAPPITVAPEAPVAKVQPAAAVRVASTPAASAAAPAPTAPASTVAPAPGSVEEIITAVFGVHARSAIGVARCESRLQPGAISRNGANWGLFQINKAHRSRVAAMGYQWEDLLDARVNALVAKSIFDEQGWRPWACRHAAR